MSDPAKTPAPPQPALRLSIPTADAVLCERCGRPNVYRMHAVWRCADGGYKTDCCGW